MIKIIFQTFMIFMYLLGAFFLLLGIYYIELLPLWETLLLTLGYILTLLMLIGCFFTNKKVLFNLGIVIAVILSLIVYSSNIYLNSTYSYFPYYQKNAFYYEKMNVYVLKNNPVYTDLDKIEGKRVGILIGDISNEMIIRRNIVCAVYYYNDIDKMVEDLYKGEIQGIVVSVKNTPTEEDSWANNVKSIYTFTARI